MPESKQERHDRLVLQAAAMREKRANKQPHVCTPLLSPTDRELHRLLNMLEKVAPDNIAPVPVATMLEAGRWTVDVTVRIKGVTDYDTEGSGESLADALAAATRNLSYRTFNERRAQNEARVYRLAY